MRIRDIRKCSVCGCNAPTGRCPDHWRCEDCGSTQKLCHYTEGVFCDDCNAKRVAKQIAEFTGNTEWLSEVVCPHCGYKYRDSWELSEGLQECGRCEHKFMMTKTIEVYYTTEKTHDCREE